LDDTLALAYENLRKLEAAESVDVGEMIRQIETAAESAQKLRALVSSELPQASWDNREELDALISGDQPKPGGKWYQAFLRRAKG
jgi:hypothetical protein